MRNLGLARAALEGPWDKHPSCSGVHATFLLESGKEASRHGHVEWTCLLLPGAWPPGPDRL